MHDEPGPGPATAAARRLPAHALASLREAFADELAERLPRLQAVARDWPDGLREQALRDAHSLASSAAMMGEADASRAARAAEALLAAGSGDGALLRARVDELSGCLAGWRP